MNTVLSYKIGNYDLHFTHRSGEFRITIGKDSRNVLLGILTLEEINTIKEKEEDLFVITNSRHTTLENIKPIKELCFDKIDYSIVFSGGGELLILIRFLKEEWDEIFNYMFNGEEQEINNRKEV